MPIFYDEPKIAMKNPTIGEVMLAITQTLCSCFNRMHTTLIFLLMKIRVFGLLLPTKNIITILSLLVGLLTYTLVAILPKFMRDV